MNKQAVYITQAHILLAGLAATFWVVSKISSGDHADSYRQETAQEKPIEAPLALKGKNLFMSKCASCHHPVREVVGPALMGFQERGPWSDKNKLYSWIRNPEEFMKNDAYTRGLKLKYGQVMQSFPNITNEEIDAIVSYLSPGPL